MTLPAGTVQLVTLGDDSQVATAQRAGLLPAAGVTGVIPSGRLKIATGPTANDTVTIGGHVFKFVTSLGAADTTTQVKNGTAAQARARLVEAINGTVDAANVTPATTPHTLTLIADEIDTDKVRIRWADAKGGNATPTSKALGTMTCAEGLTAAADIWDVANINETGKAPGAGSRVTSIVITAAMITRAKAYIEFSFTPEAGSYTVSALTSTGASRGAFTDTVVIEGNAIKITLAGGASPNFQAGDVIAVNASA